jgi:hypothetical protein
VVLPCGRIMFANKLQKSSKNLQKVQPRRANSTWTGTVTVKVSLRLGSSKLYAIGPLRLSEAASGEGASGHGPTVTSGCPVTCPQAQAASSTSDSDCVSNSASGWARRRPCLRVSRALSGCSVHSHGRDDLLIGRDGSSGFRFRPVDGAFAGAVTVTASSSWAF